jgi:hypothetical protein
MDRKPINIDIARRVSSAIISVGSDVHSVAQAADMTDLELSSRLSGSVEFQLDELVRVGGFLRTPVTNFFKEAA